MFPVSLGLWHFDLLSGVKIAHPRGGRGAGGGGWGGVAILRECFKGRENTRFTTTLTRQ